MIVSQTVCACATALCSVLPINSATGQSADPDYVAEVDAWHASREERLRSPTGWLSLVGLHTLGPGENRLGSGQSSDVLLPAFAPAEVGRIDVGDGTYRFICAAGVEATVKDVVVTDIFLQHDQQPDPTFVEVDRLLFYVIERAGQPYLRVKDTQSPLIAGFEGIQRWPVDERWRIEAVWQPYDPPKSVSIPDVLGNVNVESCPGAIVFEHEGHEVRLEPTGDPEGQLFLVFADATNGDTSYGGGRFLYAGPPRDGRIVVDFNRAYNPPCIFTPYATCPLPTPENRLDFEVDAGEKSWGEALH